MSFDDRHQGRKIILDRVLLASQVFAVFYMAIHLMVVWEAYNDRSGLAALATFVTLGLGDAFWAIHWLQFEGATARMIVAATAAVACFTSWLTRPMFNRWINSFTIDMLKDFGTELDQTLKDMRTDEPDAGQDDDKKTLSHEVDDDANDQPRPR